MMEISKHNKTALVFGVTGLVGNHLLNFLLLHPSYNRVVTFSRRSVPVEHPKLIQYKINFDRPGEWRSLVKGDDLFLCLGTTRAKAGSKEAFYKVDFTYNYNAASIAAEQGVNQLLLVSSVGADPGSMFFYSKVKGELEDAVEQLDFWSTHIFRPSVLLGERNENRFGEKIAGRIARFVDRFTGDLLSRYRPIEADIVAKAMVSAAQGLKPGVHYYPSNYLQDLAEAI